MVKTMISKILHNNQRSVSVIIVSYRRRDYLLKVLQCLRLQTHIPDQVIVVDASPIEEQLKGTEVEHLFDRIEYVRHGESGNVSRQRNVGIARATGDLILFLDDDVEFGETLIEDYFTCFDETQADGISGLILLPGQPPGKPFRPNNALGDPGGPTYLTFEGVVESHVICAASFAIRRQVLLEVQGFDEMILGTFDDVELGWRLKQAGFLVLHHNRPKVLHLRAPASGARSSDFDPSWQYSNLFYFQLRHFWARRRCWLFWLSLWQYCRPSRHWLTPAIVAGRAAALHRGYLEGRRRLKSGPRLIPSSQVAVAKEGAL